MSKHVLIGPLWLDSLSGLSLLIYKKHIWNKSHTTSCPFSLSPRSLISWTKPSCCLELPSILTPKLAQKRAGHLGLSLKRFLNLSGFDDSLKIEAPSCSPTLDSSVLHILDWSSSKQGRVSFSSGGSRILAAALTADRGFALTASIRARFPHAPTPIYLELRLDAKGLYDTITTLHESKYYRLRLIIARLRDSFGAEEIRVLRWIPGPQNLADCPTKRNFFVFHMLSHVMLVSRPSISLPPPLLIRVTGNKCRGSLFSCNFQPP
jgi:hypothetical protein